MKTREWPEHDEGELQDYGLGWHKKMSPEDYLISATAEVVSGSMEVVASGIATVTGEPRQKVSVVWLSGGTAGEVCRIMMRVETAQGRKLKKLRLLKVE